MATNVTEKDKTLNEIIDWCEQMESDGLRLASALLIQHDMAAYGAMQGQISAYEKTADHCRSLLGYSGSMPLRGMRQLRRDRRHILRHLPLLRVPAGGREASRNGRPDMVTLDPPPDLVEIAESLDAMRTAEAVSLLFILFCRDPQFQRSLYKLDPVLFRRFTNGEVWL